MHTQTSSNLLPENAYKELGPNEVYIPVLDPNKKHNEVTLWSVFWGMIMAVIFTAAAAYSGLKIGQVMEAAIPIAILAVGLSAATKRKNSLGENVIIQSIGASSGVIVAGAVFTIPALYILQLDVHFYQIFFASLLGGCLGILFLIPFRRYFVKDMHGKLPFPEATATTEILIAGARGGNQAKVLIVSGLIGGIYDFIISSLGWFSEVVTSRLIPGIGEYIANKAKIVFRIDTLSMVFGLGYIVGLKYATIICAGSFLSWFILVPLLNILGGDIASLLNATVTKPIADMTAEEIFRNYVRHIGIGGIAMAGIIGIIRSSKIIGGAMKLASNELFKGKANQNIEVKRTDQDIKILFNIALIILTILFIFVFLWQGVVTDLSHAIIALVIVTIISFLFTTVAANAIAIVGTNPVSGMTLMTLILSSFILVKVGLTGEYGMVSALIIGGIVCTALSVAGGFITDLKIGYWIGTTPKNQESFKFLGVLISASTVGFVIMILNQTYGFRGENALVAPQANAMAAVIQPLMSNIPAPWYLYLIGALIAIIVAVSGISPLAFALGMYIPLELNTPLLAGGFVANYVSKRTKDEKLNNARFQRGTLIASGFIAGGSLFGVLGALLKFIGIDMFAGSWAETHWAEAIAVVMFILLALYMIWDSLKAKVED